jgi:hypothetical protein
MSELWLDPEDSFPVRIDARSSASIRDCRREPRCARIRQAPDGSMLTILTVRYSAKLLKIHTVRGEMTRTYSDFHKFSADSTIQFTGR